MNTLVVMSVVVALFLAGAVYAIRQEERRVANRRTAQSVPEEERRSADRRRGSLSGYLGWLARTLASKFKG